MALPIDLLNAQFYAQLEFDNQTRIEKKNTQAFVFQLFGCSSKQCQSELSYIRPLDAKHKKPIAKGAG